MSMETQTMHITPANGNVFADLGFSPEESDGLMADSQRVIDAKLAIKTALMAELAAWVVSQKLRQADAAKILGVTRPRVSDVVNKKSIKFTIDSLVDMLERAGKRITLSVQ
jgi:predicted XRE-type DNA-binding protein